MFKKLEWRIGFVDARLFSQEQSLEFILSLRNENGEWRMGLSDARLFSQEKYLENFFLFEN